MNKEENTMIISNEAETISRRIVLIGTYKDRQLAEWQGWYNYPISSKDQINPKDVAEINELWLFQGVEGQQTLKAEYIGIKTHEELVRDYGYPTKDKAHNGKYILFKTEIDYKLNAMPAESIDMLIIRLSDFKTAKGHYKKLKAFLASPERDNSDLIPLLPKIISTLPSDKLCVCETAVQLELGFLNVLKPIVETNVQYNLLPVAEPKITRELPMSPLSIDDIRDSIFQADCLQVLPFFPTGSIDMVLCDLPYGTTQNKWDSVINLETLWTEYERILKPGGAVVLTSQGLFTAKLILSKPDWFKYKLVWVKSKPTNFLNAKVQPLRKHEDVCIFYSRHSTYNPVMGEGEPYDKGVRKNQLSGSYGDFHPVRVQSDGKRYPTDVIYFKTAESEGEVWHPTQKPVELGRYLVKTFSNPGDLVLDNAFGSGSFLLAAALENRHFVGIEKNESVARFKDKMIDYIEVAASRLSHIFSP
ncbi:MAG: site-specific DNA-methyltransferase [Victivallales bacterium]|nr:site-specific DNA-methyltransferase [Victivallales bacterium]